MNTNNGGNAFPAIPGDRLQGPCCYWGGMSLRDYFAAKAMQAIVAREGCKADTVTEVLAGTDPVRDARMFAGQDAARAYVYADAMLAERAKEKA